MDKDNDNLWWGFTEKDGWILLDRSIKSNGVGKKKGLIFLRCRDLTVFTDDWDDWCPPPYFYASKYIESLKSNQSKQDEAISELNALKSRILEFCDREIYRKYNNFVSELKNVEAERKKQEDEKKLQIQREDEARRKQEIQEREDVQREYEERRKQAEQEVLVEKHKKFVQSAGKEYFGISQKQKERRFTHCWSCKNPLDNITDYECNLCGWIICACGACGCGYDNKQHNPNME